MQAVASELDLAAAVFGCTTGVAAGVPAAPGTADAWPLAFSAAVEQSPDSRINGQNVPLVQVIAAGGVATAIACVTGAGGRGGATETGIAAGALAATGATDVLPLFFSAAVGQSPASRMNGHNVPLVQVLALDGLAPATSVIVAPGTGAVWALLFSVTQVSLTIGHSQLLVHDCAAVVAPDWPTAIPAGVLVVTGTADVWPFPASAVVGQSPLSRTNGHRMPLRHSAVAACVTCIVAAGGATAACGFTTGCDWAGCTAGGTAGVAAAWGFTAVAGKAGCAPGRAAGGLSLLAELPADAPEPVELLADAAGAAWQSPLPNGQYQLWLHWIAFDEAAFVCGGGLIVLTSTRPVAGPL